jgi:hypothetical protein
MTGAQRRPDAEHPEGEEREHERVLPAVPVGDDATDIGAEERSERGAAGQQTGFEGPDVQRLDDEYQDHTDHHRVERVEERAD